MQGEEKKRKRENQIPPVKFPSFSSRLVRVRVWKQTSQLAGLPSAAEIPAAYFNSVVGPSTCCFLGASSYPTACTNESKKPDWAARFFKEGQDFLRGPPSSCCSYFPLPPVPVPGPPASRFPLKGLSAPQRNRRSGAGRRKST